MSRKDEFIRAFGKIKRPGAEELLVWLLEETDFFTAPASTKYHGAYPGGLLEHTMNVYNRLQEIAERELLALGEFELPAYVEETVAIVALFHDLCKVNVYREEVRRRKNAETGIWEEHTAYIYKDGFPLGHGEKSLYQIMQFLPITEEEALAIRWHMGAYDSAARGGSKTLSEAMKASRLVWWLHEADMCATYIDEQEDEE